MDLWAFKHFEKVKYFSAAILAALEGHGALSYAKISTVTCLQ